ncbi:uncharacterized protein LOC132201420 [Neocloeon triangulifer]|uniref:uncharacterized protein LOC132201420 n=1 Tax=Neocloeon triangulifer TaxID=2078957 RepID=UPI00286EF8D5|nr:uncharacterized protein LOC132201420 [Neocloeon triangulifer]
MAKKPLGPNSPPPPRGRGENKSGHDLTILKTELEHEKRLRRTILWSNRELQRIVYELEDEIIQLDSEDPDLPDPGNEWWVRLVAQNEINKQLEQQKKWLELELEQIIKQKEARPPKTMNFDLDLLTETELIRLVKRLERQRTDMYSTLRNLEWRLDREGREHQRLAEMKTMQQAELYHYTKTLDRLNKQSQRATINSNFAPSIKLISDPKLPPLDIVQPPASTSKWGQSSETKRTFNPNKGPIRRTAGVRNLPKLQDKKSIITTPRGKIDKRTRRIKSGNKQEKRKEDSRSATKTNEETPKAEESNSTKGSASTNREKSDQGDKEKGKSEVADADQELSKQLSEKLEITEDSTKDKNSSKEEKSNKAGGDGKKGGKDKDQSGEKKQSKEIECN